MSELTQLDRRALKEFESALETFKTNVTKRCNSMESGLDGCSRFMLDETSKNLIRQSQQTISDIRECLNPTIHLLEKIYLIVNEMERGLER